MTIEEIRKNAPDGAKFYHDIYGRLIRYVMLEFGQAYYWDNWRKNG